MSITDRFPQVRVVVIGDVMLDRFVSGQARRISPESPVPVLSVSESVNVAGGAANVARNIAALGGLCTLIGVAGEDPAGRELSAMLERTPGIEPALRPVGHRVTTEKVRFVAQGQHMLRSDREDTRPVDGEVEDWIVARCAAALPSHQVVVLSDYAKGVLTPSLVRRVIALANGAGVPVIVDPKTPDLARYDGATLVTPNLNEVWMATGRQPREDEAVVEAAQQILEATRIGAVLVTRSERGMTLVDRSGAPVHIAAAAREVADVVGAGDTVIATLALSVGAGGALDEAARLANAAAGIVVGKRGTATLSHAELVDELDRQSGRGLVASSVKVLSRAEAAAQVEAWRASGAKVGFTNGCFDILHVGHVAILEFARAHCDRLVVGINTDASVRRLKGPSRPVNGTQDRARLLAALAVVDAVVAFEEDTPAAIIEELAPDVLVKGADYQLSEIVGADGVLARGGQVLRFDLVPGRSTTGLIRKAREGVE